MNKKKNNFQDEHVRSRANDFWSPHYRDKGILRSSVYVMTHENDRESSVNHAPLTHIFSWTFFLRKNVICGIHMPSSALKSRCRNL